MSNRYRFTCKNHTSTPFETLAAAEAKVRGIEQNPDACYLLHTVEVEQPDGEWLALHEHRARLILAAPLGGTIEGPNGPLIKSAGGWSAGAGERANAAGVPGSEAWLAALGPHETTTLTADGRGAETGIWCQHKTPASTWVRYERWSPRGVEAHGYVCPREFCRRLVQSG